MTDSCDQEVYHEGKVIAVLGDVAGEIVEVWCKRIAQDSGAKVDWYWMAGRAIVKAIGDLKKVDAAAFWMFGDGLSENDNKLKHLGGSKSWYGYHPNGPNHWSNK